MILGHNRRVRGVLTTIGCVAVLAVTGAAAAATEDVRRPALRVASHAPLKVNGLHFKRGERVRVVAEVGRATYTRTVRATTAGTFAVTFVGVRANDPCALELRAVGALGSRAAFKLPERMCPIGDAPAELADPRR